MAWLKWPYFFQVLLNGDASRTGKAGSAPGLEMASMAAPNVDYKLWCQSLQVELFCFFSKSPGWNPKMYVHNNLRMNERITRFFYTDTYTICIRNRNSCFSSCLIYSHLLRDVSQGGFLICNDFWAGALISQKRGAPTIHNHLPSCFHQHKIAFPSQAFLPLSMAGVTNTNLQPGLHPVPSYTLQGDHFVESHKLTWCQRIRSLKRSCIRAFNHT